MTKIVGLCGAPGNGKTALAKMLEKRHGYIHAPFAGPLKAMVEALLLYQGFTPEFISAIPKEEKLLIFEDQSRRHCEQTLGTQWGRELIGPNLWINAWNRKIRMYHHVVVDDVRFPNEELMLRNQLGKLFRITRNSAPLLAEGPKQHQSEAYWPHFTVDAEIPNDGDIEETFEKLWTAIQE